ncbi:uncharacterized protein LOC124671685 [Lolium rigidum]|uniref:uncharacterized protein LOC124671685 n=1 Tax=Lolium rigidum TaxID=89674 RepID=UPI001F5CF3B1|nr:uncharacterized protein LOC124671685 [Lolium rigidum]
MALGLVWLHPFPGGSTTFPGANKPRAELPRVNPPSRLDSREPAIPRRFRVQPGEPVPPVVRRGRDSARRLASGGDSGGDDDRISSPPHLRQPNPSPPYSGNQTQAPPHLTSIHIASKPLPSPPECLEDPELFSATIVPPVRLQDLLCSGSNDGGPIQILGTARSKKRIRSWFLLMFGCAAYSLLLDLQS